MTDFKDLQFCLICGYVCFILWVTARAVVKELIKAYERKGIDYYDYDVKGIPPLLAPFVLKKIEKSFSQSEEAEMD